MPSWESTWGRVITDKRAQIIEIIILSLLPPSKLRSSGRVRGWLKWGGLRKFGVVSYEKLLKLLMGTCCQYWFLWIAGHVNEPTHSSKRVGHVVPGVAVYLSGLSTSHRTWVLFVLLPSGQVCPVEETSQTNFLILILLPGLLAVYWCLFCPRLFNN